MNDNGLQGAVPGMSADDYHSSPAMGSSGLKRFAVSPAHYWADYLDPDRKPRDKKVFRLGRAWHCAVFEPRELDRRYAAGHDAHPATKRATLLQGILAAEAPLAEAQRLVALPEGLKSSTKEGKQLVADLEAEGKVPVDAADFAWVGTWLPKLLGKDVLSGDDIERVIKMARIARSLPISRVIFDQLGAEHGAAEVSLFATDPATGVLLKVRPDYMLRPCGMFPHGLIIDGKSTVDASPGPDGFGRQVWNLDYGLASALYPRVFQQVFRTAEPPPFFWLAQEKESPYAAKFYPAGDSLRAYWNRRIDQLLPRVAECQRTGVWPAYGDDVTPLELPVYAEKRLEDAA